jgi:hypothetical protein
MKEEMKKKLGQRRQKQKPAERTQPTWAGFEAVGKMLSPQDTGSL